jgi:hypothetical protein
MTAMTSDQSRSPEALRAEMVDRIVASRYLQLGHQ